MKRFISLIMVIAMAFAHVAAVAEENPTIAFDADSYSVPVGKNINIKTTVTPKKNLKLEWFSSNEEVATVNAKGQVKGISEGETEISVKAIDNEAVTATCKVTVVIPVKKITLSENKVEMPKDMIWNLSASIEPENATNKQLEWSSSNERIATVNQDGMIKSKAIGTTKITAAATDGSKVKATINVKVDQFDIVLDGAGSSDVLTLYSSIPGGSNIIVKSKNDLVDWQITMTGMFITSEGPSNPTEFTFSPKKPGIDILTFTIGGSSIKKRAFVSPKGFEDPQEVDKRKDIVGGTNENGEDSGNGQILFKGVPWGASYKELYDILTEKGDRVKSAIIRSKTIWTQIDGDLVVGKYKAYKNGLSFSYENITEENLEECKEKCKFFKADCYFEPEIPFAELKQSILQVYGLSESDAKMSDDAYTWIVNDVTIELAQKKKFSQLTLTCNSFHSSGE